MFPGHATRYHDHHKKHKHSHQISNPPDDYTSTYDVRMFGAVGDGETDDTEAFKRAWDNACQTDSGVLLVPYGYTFIIQSTIFTGPCQTGFVFQVNFISISDIFGVDKLTGLKLIKVAGTIMAPEGPECWARNNSRRQWLVFYRVKEMLLTGGGLIEGRGQGWWSLPCKPHNLPNGTIVREPSCDSPIVIN